MGQKYKRLYDEITSFENLVLAARKAARGKRLKPATAEFEFEREKLLFEIQAKLQNGDYEFGGYNSFTITDPKERLICAAPYQDRVVHHAVCNIIEPLLDKAMIHDSYACRSGKGMHKALDKAQEFLRKNKWVFKFDLKKYFFSIDHELLLALIAKKITDPKVLQLIKKLLATYNCGDEYYLAFANDSLFDYARKRGLPIGNLTSQIFANYFLNPLDLFIKQQLKCKYYIRYMDDALIYAETKQELSEIKDKISSFLVSWRLKFHEKKCNIFPASHGISFLGFHLYQTYRKISRPNLQRFKKRMKVKSYLYHNCRF